MRTACKRLLRFELACGFSQWYRAWHQRRHVMQLALNRFRHSSLYAAVRAWAGRHPPMTRLRRALMPYTARVAELERALRREREDHETTRTLLEARIHDLEEVTTRRMATVLDTVHGVCGTSRDLGRGCHTAHGRGTGIGMDMDIKTYMGVRHEQAWSEHDRVYQNADWAPVLWLCAGAWRLDV